MIRKKRKNHPVINFILLFAFFGLSSWSLSKFLIVRHIRCFTQFGPCPDEFTRPLQPFINSSLVSPPVSQIRSALSAYPQIAGVDVYRRLPRTLAVAVTLRKPLGSIGPETAFDTVSVVDENGIVMSIQASLNLPHLIDPAPPPVSGAVSPIQLSALKILHVLSSDFSGQLTASLRNNFLSVNSPRGILILIDVDRPLDDWLPSLQFILNRSKIADKSPRLIDVRYPSVVIR